MAERDASLADPTIESYTHGVLDTFALHIALLDGDGVIRSVNAAWRKFAFDNGLAHDQTGVNYLDVCDHARGIASEEAPVAAEGIRGILLGRLEEFTLDYPCHAPDRRAWYRMSVHPLPPGLDVKVVVAHEDITYRRIADDTVRRSQTRLLSIREEERRRLAIDLHDNLGQRLFALVMSMQNCLVMSERGGGEQALRAALSRSIALGNDIIRDVRSLSQGLYPQTLEQLGLPGALAQLLTDYREMQQVKLTVSDDIGQRRFRREVELGVFRVAQEAVGNAIRHSRSRHIEVTLGMEDNHLALTVTDDGVGFDLERQKGIGITSMCERCTVLGGTLHIQSHPGHTEVRAVIPVNHPW